MRARFAREGELLARLTHPHIARLLDAGLTDDRQRFLVLELVVGQDITTFVKAAGLDQRATVALFRQVLAAVAFAHSQLVVHRDIKPGNVMVTTSGQVKLLNFGVARLLDSDETEGNLTHVVGAAYTEAYAAPEQLRGDAVGTAADVFSLGCVLHQLLVNDAPHWPLPKRELVPGMLPAPVANPLFVADLRAITMKALAVAPDERYATVAAFDDDLSRFLNGEAVNVRHRRGRRQCRQRKRHHHFAARAIRIQRQRSHGGAFIRRLSTRRLECNSLVAKPSMHAWAAVENMLYRTGRMIAFVSVLRLYVGTGNV